MSTAETTDLAPSLAQQDNGAAIRPSFMTGFDGMASEPFPEANRKVLAEHVPPEAVEIRPDGIVFVPGVYYRRQLTKAFGAGGWALAPRGPARVMGDLVVWPGALYCLGRFVSEAVGECMYHQNSNMSYASCVEGAKTDALSRCCKDLGMATELWDAAWRDQWKKEYAEQYDGEKWNSKTRQMVKARLWRLRSGRPVQNVDLMSGAGAPSAPASAPAATPPPAAPVAPSGERPKAEAIPATAPPGVEGTTAGDAGRADTGEAATEQQRTMMRDEVKRLGWKGHFYKMWLKTFFGFDSPGALSQDQATNAILLLEHYGTEKYKALIEDMRADGLIKPAVT
jgi:hypothetical protein